MTLLFQRFYKLVVVLNVLFSSYIYISIQLGRLLYQIALHVITCVDTVHLNLLLYHLLGHVTFVSHYVDDDVTARICDMTYYVKDS